MIQKSMQKILLVLGILPVLLFSSAAKDPANKQELITSLDLIHKIESVTENQNQTEHMSHSVHSIKDFTAISVIENQNVSGKYFAEIGGCSDDSLFYTVYSNGIIILEHVGISYYYVGDFPPTTNGLRPGMSMGEIKQKLGIPFRESKEILTYNAIDEFLFREQGEREEYPAFHLFFKDGILIGVKIIDRGTC